MSRKPLSQETDLFPVAANAILDIELKLFRTLNSVSLVNAELTRNNPVKILAYELCGLRTQAEQSGDVSQLKAGINSGAYRSACVQRHKSGLQF